MTQMQMTTLKRLEGYHNERVLVNEGWDDF